MPACLPVKRIAQSVKPLVCSRMGALACTALLLTLVIYRSGLGGATGTGTGRLGSTCGAEDARGGFCNASEGRDGGREGAVDVGFLLCRVDEYPGLVRKLEVMATSLLEEASVPVRFHVFVCDQRGFDRSVEVVGACAGKLGMEAPEMIKQNITELLADYSDEARHLQSKVSKPGTYYHDQLFVVAPFLHSLHSRNVSRLLMLDVDLKFLADVKLLFDQFQHFPETAFFGVAPELSPVYYHMLYQFRKQNPKSQLGSTDPKHMQGVNSGVLLVDVAKMKSNVNYQSYLLPGSVDALFEKYRVENRGHLGDQDFLALLSFEKPEFFYFLDCGWNRALCQFWKKVYPDIFDSYYFCDKPVKIYHGNCDSLIPP